MVGSQYGEQEYVLLPGTNGIGTDGWPVTDARSPSAVSEQGPSLFVSSLSISSAFHLPP